MNAEVNTIKTASRWLGAALFFLPLASNADARLQEMAQKDARLLRKVTLHAPQILIGDLLGELGRQGGISISCGRIDGAADERVSVFVDERPLHEIMDSLWSLLSYKQATFEWQVSGESPNWAYRLLRPLRARNFPQVLQNLAQDLYEEMVAQMVSAAQAQPAERRRIVTRMVRELLDGNDAMIKGYMDIEWSWDGIALFARCLSSQQRSRLIRGQNVEQRFAVKDLDAAGQRFVHSIWARTKAQRRLDNGETTPIPIPTWISFRNNTRGSGATAPILMIDMEDIGGYGYIGGVPLEAAIRKRIADMWMNAGDQEATPHESKPLSSPLTTTPDRKSLVMPPVQSRLSRSASAAGISVLARVSDKYNRDFGPPMPNTVAGLLDQLEERPPHFQHKWRDGFLLLDYPSWFQDPPIHGTWAAAVELRDAREKHGGVLSLEDLVGVARTLQTEQLRKLSVEFPVLNHVASSQEILASLAPTKARVKQLSSDAGILLDNDVRKIVASNRYLGPALSAYDVRAVRVAEIRHDETNPVTNEFVFGFIDNANRWIPVFGFRDKPAAIH